MPCEVTEGEARFFEDRRVAELEQALCGLCQQMEARHMWEAGSLKEACEEALHPQLRAWFDKHKKLPGCDAP